MLEDGFGCSGRGGCSGKGVGEMMAVEWWWWWLMVMVVVKGVYEYW